MGRLAQPAASYAGVALADRLRGRSDGAAGAEVVAQHQDHVDALNHRALQLRPLVVDHCAGFGSLAAVESQLGGGDQMAEMLVVEAFLRPAT